MMKSKETYAVLKNGVMQESDTWQRRPGWCLVHVSGKVFPLSIYQIIVKDKDHYLIEGAEYAKNDFVIRTQADAAKLMSANTVIKATDEGDRLKSPDDEVIREADKMPDVNDGDFKPFTRCVINLIRMKGKPVTITATQHNKKRGIIRKLKKDFSLGNKELSIDDATFLLSTFNIDITEILNEKYI